MRGSIVLCHCVVCKVLVMWVVRGLECFGAPI